MRLGYANVWRQCTANRIGAKHVSTLTDLFIAPSPALLLCTAVERWLRRVPPHGAHGSNRHGYGAEPAKAASWSSFVCIFSSSLISDSSAVCSVTPRSISIPLAPVMGIPSLPPRRFTALRLQSQTHFLKPCGSTSPAISSGNFREQRGLRSSCGDWDSLGSHRGDLARVSQSRSGLRRRTTLCRR